MAVSFSAWSSSELREYCFKEEAMALGGKIIKYQKEELLGHAYNASQDAVFS
jgi:hypothetical protein